MANPIAMKNPKTGELKTGYTGFSWTTLFFGFFPALFRADWITFIGVFVVYSILTATTGFGGIIAMFVWAFLYNRHYTLGLIKNGFVMNGSHEENKAAAIQLKIELNEHNCSTVGNGTEPVPVPEQNAWGEEQKPESK